MQDDMEDMLDDVNEIQESLGRQYGVPDNIDEADLEAGTRMGIRNPNLVNLLTSPQIFIPF